MALTPKTLGLPPSTLDELEIRVREWTDHPARRPNSMPAWGNVTWADVVREAIRLYFLKLPVVKKKAAKRGARR